MAIDAATVGADEAARLLGVTRRTLYAYVSRGVIRSEPGPGPSRARRYPRAELDALMKARSGSPQERATRSAMSWGLPVIDSSLTLIDGGRLFYRGRDAVALSRTATLEDVAALLWSDVDRPHIAFPAGGRVDQRSGPTALARMERWLVSDGARSAVTAGGPAATRGRDAAKLVAGLFAAAGAAGDGPLAERLAHHWGTGRVDAISAALVLCADHEFNVSAFTARCVASADARLDQVLLGALCAFQGRRHGGMGSRIATLIDDAHRRDAAQTVARALDDQGEVPGFGHRLYPAGDPRAIELLRLAPEPARGDAAGAVAARCAETLGLAPNLDFALAALERRLRFPAGAGATLFALGRSVGWIAHAIETWEDGSLIRPRARYVGPPTAP